MSLRMANLAERAIGRLWDGTGRSVFHFGSAAAALCARLPDKLTNEHIRAYRLACDVDQSAADVPHEAQGRSARKRQLIRALGLTLIAELAERGEL